MRFAVLQTAQIVLDIQELECLCIRVLMDPPLVHWDIESDHFIVWFDIEIFIQIDCGVIFVYWR